MPADPARHRCAASHRQQRTGHGAAPPATVHAHSAGHQNRAGGRTSVSNHPAWAIAIPTDYTHNVPYCTGSACCRRPLAACCRFCQSARPGCTGTANHRHSRCLASPLHMDGRRCHRASPTAHHATHRPLAVAGRHLGVYTGRFAARASNAPNLCTNPQIRTKNNQSCTSLVEVMSFLVHAAIHFWHNFLLRISAIDLLSAESS